MRATARAAVTPARPRRLLAEGAVAAHHRSHAAHPCRPATRIVESPGLSLSEDELEALVAQLRVVAAKTLPQESLTYGIFSGERERLSRAIVTLIS